MKVRIGNEWFTVYGIKQEVPNDAQGYITGTGYVTGLRTKEVPSFVDIQTIDEVAEGGDRLSAIFTHARVYAGAPYIICVDLMEGIL